MLLYQINNENLTPIKKVEIKKEKDLQTLTENNLEELFNLKFIATEFTVDNFRIDTLAFNEETNSFVIIEYKKNQSYSVIDQGYSYLGLLLNNKAEFVLKYNENSDTSIGKNDVDWSQTLVMFIAPKFSKYQLKAVEFNDLAFDLIEVSRFDNGTIIYNKIENLNSTASIKEVSKSNQITKKVDKEIKRYTEENHLESASDEVKELYEELRDRVLLECPESSEFFTKVYFGFKANKKIFFTAKLQQRGIKAWINIKSNELEDYKNLTKDVTNIGHHGIGDYQIKIKNFDDLNYVLFLAKQAYDEKIQ